MPNAIRYTTGAETLALKKANFYIGTGDVGKGPTSSTDYWNGTTPQSGGYTIYLGRVTNGPSIYSAANDAELITLTNLIAGASYTTAEQCLVYFAGQTDKMVTNRDYEGIITDGIVLNLDGGFTPSYPKSGTTIYDLSLSVNNGVLTNGPTYTSNDGGVINYDGTDDYTSITNSNSLYLPNAMSIQFFVKVDTIPSVAGGNRMWLVTKGQSNQFEWQTSINNFGSEFGKWCFLRYASATPGGALDGGAFRGRASSSDAVTGVWTNVAFTLASPSSLNDVYLNGVLNNGATLSQNNMNVSQGTANVRLGTRDFGEKYLDGSLGDVLIYNRQLSATEVLQNYNALKSRYGL